MADTVSRFQPEYPRRVWRNIAPGYVEQRFVPVLKPGNIVIRDNLGRHKSTALRRIVRTADAKP